jgi:cytosine permease
MSNGGLPSYITAAKPNPPDARTAWYKSTAPTYAGIFLWVVFYMEIPTFLPGLGSGGIGLAILALIVAGLICHFLFYLVPGLLGMKTGYPLYVVGSSTYGTLGGFLMPGLLMGILQFGWLAVNTAISTDFLLQAFGRDSAMQMVDGALVFTGSPVFTIVAIVWAVAAVTMGVLGIQYIAKIASVLPLVPLLMLLIGVFLTLSGLGSYEAPAEAAAGGSTTLAFLGLIGMVVGFFATAGAAGVDFGMGNRNAQDVQWGGLVGIALAIVITGGFAVLIVAGAHGKTPDLASFRFDATIKDGIGGFLASSMFVLFAIASFAPACFCTFIATNSVGTMFPSIPKMVSALCGAAVSIVLAATGVAMDLVGVFNIIGASFGPICGAMAADYLLSGMKWPGPRRGVNLAGYISWAVGFVVAILPMVAKDTFSWITPAPVIAFVIGFVLYAVLAKAGLEPEAAPLPGAQDA